VTLRPSRRAMLAAAITVFLLHSVVALWTWETWGYFGRGNVITWMDFPLSLAYLHLEGTPMLLWSLFGGGLQWAGLAALLTFLVGRTLRRRSVGRG
jgi:hypothetical protein